MPLNHSSSITCYQNANMGRWEGIKEPEIKKNRNQNSQYNALVSQVKKSATSSLPDGEQAGAESRSRGK